MTDRQAKEILLLYRPDSADANDAEFAEALACIRRSPELQDWFEKHCAVQNEIRARFRQMAAPEGLKEQIISEYKARSIGSQLKKAALLAAVAVVVTLGIIFAGRLTEREKVVEDKSFAAYLSRMVRTVSRGYSMDLETNDLAQIRSYLAQRQAITDWKLPAALEQTALAGCGVLGWQGKPVSMICFLSGKPLPPAQKSDVFLFVIDSTNVENPPTGREPEIAQVNNLLTATWSADGKTYVLATEGDEAQLRRYL